MLSFSSGQLFAFSLPDYIIISLNASSHNLRTPVRIMVARKNVTQLCLTLYDPLDYSLLGSSVHRILQTRILEWIAIPFSREFSQPRDRTQVCLHSCTAGRFFTSEPLGKPISQVKKNAFLTLFPHAILCLKRSILRNKL